MKKQLRFSLLTTILLFAGTVLFAQNHIPYTQGSKSAITVIGSNVCLNILTADDDPGDTVRISWSTSVTGATFTHNSGAVRLATGQICWTPAAADTAGNPHLFFVTLDDGTDQKVDTFSITVYGFPAMDSFSYSEDNCGNFVLHPRFNIWTDTFYFRLYDSANNLLLTFADTNYFSYNPNYGPGRYLLRTFMANKVPVSNMRQDTLILRHKYGVSLNKTALSEPNEYLLEIQKRFGNPLLTYEWYRHNSLGWDTLMHTGSSLTVQVWENTTYMIVVDNGQGCHDTLSQLIQVDPNGLSQPDPAAVIYPNPAGNWLNLESTSASLVGVSIHTITGKRILWKQFSATNHYLLDSRYLESGVYFIRLFMNDGSIHTQRLQIRNE